MFGARTARSRTSRASSGQPAHTEAARRLTDRAPRRLQRRSRGAAPLRRALRRLRRQPQQRAGARRHRRPAPGSARVAGPAAARPSEIQVRIDVHRHVPRHHVGRGDPRVERALLAQHDGAHRVDRPVRAEGDGQLLAVVDRAALGEEPVQPAVLERRASSTADSRARSPPPRLPRADRRARVAIGARRCGAARRRGAVAGSSTTHVRPPALVLGRASPARAAPRPPWSCGRRRSSAGPHERRGASRLPRARARISASSLETHGAAERAGTPAPPRSCAGDERPAPEREHVLAGQALRAAAGDDHARARGARSPERAARAGGRAPPPPRVRTIDVDARVARAAGGSPRGRRGAVVRAERARGQQLVTSAGAARRSRPRPASTPSGVATPGTPPHESRVSGAVSRKSTEPSGSGSGRRGTRSPCCSGRSTSSPRRRRRATARRRPSSDGIVDRRGRRAAAPTA